MQTFSNSMISSREESYFHGHELILNEDYHSREGDLCYGCGSILQSPSAVYRCIYFSSPAEDDCAHFFLHKVCARLPSHIKHPSHGHHLELIRRLSGLFVKDSCDICGIKLEGLCYRCYDCVVYPHEIYQICLTCVVPLKNVTLYPAYHCHKLTLSTRLATFYCDACHKVETDFSYMCNTCPFWIHLSCSNLPMLLKHSSHHKHPLFLAFSLPEMYRKFPQSCRICPDKLYHSHWVYYCPNCRFFAHVKCATSPPISRSRPYDEAAFENFDHELLSQKYFKRKIICWLEGAPVTPPVHINHWSHEQHQMLLRNRSGLSVTEDEELLICNGCTKSIFTSDDSDNVFYECGECEYILHRYCALFPKEMQHVLGGKLVGFQPSVHDIWSCTCCGGYRNGTQMRLTYVSPGKKDRITDVKLDTECALLPRQIKHKIHDRHRVINRHGVIQNRSRSDKKCLACHKIIREGDIHFMCFLSYCDFRMHTKCALKPLKVTHRWDPHPLYLIYSVEEVIDHPHEFHCEFCSEEIDTNLWFYHCSVCDLSFHFEECIDLFPYSRVKFGATGIKIQGHEHSLTFVLNKKCQPCQRCHKSTYGKPVLKCTPCNFIQHAQPDLCC